MSETNIKVAVRLRSPLMGESVVEDGSITINSEGTSIEVKNMLFSFDHVFNHNVSNEELYATLISKKIKSLFKGFNCTILAYGSTGSGKTFTMGTASKVSGHHNGLISLGMKDIFKSAKSIEEETDVIIKASFFEIYMENIKDLLKTESSFVPGDSKEAKITNMTTIVVQNYDEAMQALRKGVKVRTTGVTAKNSKSSRSHAFFVISLAMTDKKSGRSIFSKFQLIDLAGSERAGTDTTGKELKQGIQINKGLTALGRVISSLSKKERHIPYRDSVLTRYLQDSFGGNSYTVMVTCISPAQANLEETVSSLRYSYFAKRIKNTVTVNRDSTDLIEHLKLEVERLRKIEHFPAEKVEMTNQINYLNECLARDENNLDIIREKVMNFSVNIQSLGEKMILESFGNPLLNPYIEVLQEIKEDLNKFATELMEKKSLYLQEKKQPTTDGLKNSDLEQRIINLEMSLEALNSGKPCVIDAQDVSALDGDMEAINYIERSLCADATLNKLRCEMSYIKSLMIKEFEGYKELLSEGQSKNEQAETVSSSIEDNFAKRIKFCEHNLDIYEDQNSAKLSLLKEETARFCLDYLYGKQKTKAPISQDNLSPSQDPKTSKEIELEKELGEVKQEKKHLELMHQKQILELNKEWEQKVLDVWKNRDNTKVDCDEVNELKEKLRVLEEENKQLRSAQLQLPTLTSQAKGSRKKKSEAQDCSMIEAYLSEDEPSFIQESERLDPDYRATPLWKRNKLKTKRKLPEDSSAVSINPTTPKNFSASGCSCPGDCSTMRCSCQKKKKMCSAFCICNTTKCINISPRKKF